jgi:hypothetical protein
MTPTGLPWGCVVHRRGVSREGDTAWNGSFGSASLVPWAPVPDI